jgi:hypothetical protein
MVGRGHDHCIDGFIGEKLAEVGVEFGLVTRLASADEPGTRFASALERIAQGD